MKKFLAIVLCLVMALSLFGCGGSGNAGGEGSEGAEPVVITLGHALSDGTPASNGINDFAARVEKETEGRVSFDIYPNSQLGNETEMIEQMQLGQLDAGAIMVGTFQTIDQKFAIEDLPYMWNGIESARAAYDGAFGDYMADLISQYGMTEIAYVEWGFRHITNNKGPIVEPEDMKGLNIRISPAALREDAFKQVGAIPTQMSFSELYSALQTGVVEAQENPLPTIVAAGFAEVQDYLSLTGHFYNTVMFVINTDVWNKISEEDQAIILAAAKDMEKEVRVNNDASTEANIQALKDAGMQVNDDVDKEAFREAMLPVYDKWEKDVFGEELMDVYRSCSGW